MTCKTILPRKIQKEKIGYRNSRTGHMRTMHAIYYSSRRGVYIYVCVCVWGGWGGGRGCRAISEYEIDPVAGFIGCIETKSDVQIGRFQPWISSETGDINPSMQRKRDSPHALGNKQEKRGKKTEAFTYLVEPDRHDMYDNQYFLLPWTRTEYIHGK